MTQKSSLTPKSIPPTNEPDSFAKKCKTVAAATVVLASLVAGVIKIADYTSEKLRPAAVAAPREAPRHFPVHFVRHDVVHHDERPAQDLIVVVHGQHLVPNDGGVLDLPVSVLEQPLDVFFDGTRGRIARAIPGKIVLPVVASHEHDVGGRFKIAPVVLEVVPQFNEEPADEDPRIRVVNDSQ